MDTAMASSTSLEPATEPAPREVRLDTVSAQVAAIDELIVLAQSKLQVFDIDLSQFKNCTAHFERMKTRASVQMLLAFEKTVQAEFAKVA